MRKATHMKQEVFRQGHRTRLCTGHQWDMTRSSRDCKLLKDKVHSVCASDLGDSQRSIMPEDEFKFVIVNTFSYYIYYFFRLYRNKLHLNVCLYSEGRSIGKGAGRKLQAGPSAFSCTPVSLCSSCVIHAPQWEPHGVAASFLCAVHCSGP